MEPICWAGIVGVIAIAAAIGSMLKGPCKTKKETPPTVDNSPVASGVDENKEKAINDLIK